MSVTVVEEAVTMVGGGPTSPSIAVAELVEKIEACFKAVTRAFGKGPKAVKEVNRLKAEFDKLEGQHQALTGNTYIQR